MRAFARLATALLASAPLACGGERLLFVEQVEGAESALLQAENGEGWFLPLRAPSTLRLPIDGPVETRVWQFAQTLAELQVGEGPVEPWPGCGARALPTPLADRSDLVDGDGVARPAPSTPHVAPLLRPLDVEACADVGGCLAEAGRGQFCRADCEVTVDPPAPPTPPEGVPGPPEACRDETQVWLPGGCRDLSPCAEAMPAADVYVSATASGDGDGSRARPFPDLATAVARVPPWGTIALSSGRHPAAVRIPGGIEVRGLCARRTVLEGPVELGGGTLADLEVQGTLSGHGRAERLIVGDVEQSSQSWLRMADVEVRGTLSADGGLVLSRASVGADTATTAAIRLSDGARLTVTESVVRGPISVGSQLYSFVEVSDSVLLGGITMPGRGDAAVELHRVRASAETGAVVALNGTLLAEDVRLLGSGCCGVTCGARVCDVEARRIEVEGSRYGVFVSSFGARVVLEDFVTSDVRTGVEVAAATEDGTLELRRAAVRGAEQNGIWIRGVGNSVTLEDLEITGPSAAGLRLTTSGSAIVRRIAVQDTTDVGVEITDGGRFELSDLRLSGGDNALRLGEQVMQLDLRRSRLSSARRLVEWQGCEGGTPLGLDRIALTP